MPPSTGRAPYYGLVGNGHTAALVAPDGAIAWLCVPRFDGPPAFAAALDPLQGGELRLKLVSDDGRRLSGKPAAQTYLEQTNVLQTSVQCEDLLLTATDYMPWQDRLLVREVTVHNGGGTAGGGLLEVGVRPVDARAIRVAVQPDAAGLAVALEQSAGVGPRQGALYLTSWPAPQASLEDRLLVDLGTIPPGASVQATLLLALGPDPSTARRDALGAQKELAQGRGPSRQAEAAFWRAWLEQGRPLPGEHALHDVWRHAYQRSLLAMKLLSHPDSGGLLAAPTASLPAVPGGPDNWDYRYVWLRDGAYAAMALDDAGFFAEAEAFYRWAFCRQGEDGHWAHPLYTLDGQAPEEVLLDDLVGPGGETPLRLGNAASRQLQLDNEGNVLCGVWHHFEVTGDRRFLQAHWEGIRRAAGWTAAHWNEAESGIWEIREYRGHWVHGKALCFGGLRAAASVADELGYPQEAARWREVAEQIRSQVLSLGWSVERQAYLRDYRPDAPLDISALALLQCGLLTASDPRLQATVARMERPASQGGLMHDGGVARYDYAALPFYLPTFWLAQYYLMAGRTGDADRLIDTCLASATDLLLMAEHFDPRTGRQWGNFPQLFSHEELVRTLALRQAAVPATAEG